MTNPWEVVGMSSKMIGGCVRLFGFAIFLASVFFGGDAPKAANTATGETWPVLWISRVTPDHFRYVSPSIWFAWIIFVVGGAILFFGGDKIALRILKRHPD